MNYRKSLVASLTWALLFVALWWLIMLAMDRSRLYPKS